MADLAISVAGKLMDVIGSEAIQKICGMWGYNDELEDLNKTIITIKNVLSDADSKRDLSEVQHGYIAELKDVVYDADDLFDEFRTLVELDQIGSDKGGKFFGKVRCFFSSKKGKLSQAYRMSRRVEEIKGHLDAIANNYTRFGFSVDYKPIVRRREETCSYVDVKDIIGRDKDKDVIIDTLFAANCSRDDEGFCFLTIVGVGGLGKTALAQLVFHDDMIEKEFPSSRIWVCVSDQDGEQFHVKTILCKILEVVTKKMLHNSSSMQLVQDQFLEHFGKKKYFIVLDDVWNEDRNSWAELKKFLVVGARGSKIVVTSRSEKTSGIIGSKYTYKLEALSKEDSKHLFEMIAFEEGEKHSELVKIGETIAQKCCGNPLAIKVIGSLLYGQDITKWQSIEKSRLADIGKGDHDKILSILKLSYHNLTPSLKSCFSYCSVFPKDSYIGKEMLISLWMAQGYIVSLDGGQRVEDSAEEHFTILMRRCFFQDIQKDEYGNVVCVKIHDLMHDVAQEVGKEEICVVTFKASNIGGKIRHVNIAENCDKISLCSSKIRSCICNGRNKQLLNKQMQNMIALRVLDLSDVGTCFEVYFLPSVSLLLPQNIDKLLLLRYLDLQKNRGLEVLPDAITRLYNLQTLILRFCTNLREVPKDFSNLINLRHLDFYRCNKLKRMPLGILKLANLKVLPYFKTRNEISLEEFKVLQQVFTRLKGKINIMNADSESLQPLEKLSIVLFDKGEWVIREDVLKKLELPPYLNELGFSEYKGNIMPWQEICVPHYLRRIDISSCDNLEQIPVLSKLPHLQTLKLFCLNSVKYMEYGTITSSIDIKSKAELFPSLESLVIICMEKLRGWWSGDFPRMRLIFPRLSHLKIEKCPNLKSFIPENSESLQITSQLGKLRELEIDNEEYIKLLPPTNNCIGSLKLKSVIDMESAVGSVQSFASSLRTLKICECENMSRLPRLDHFIALEHLVLMSNYKLYICEEDDEMQWKSLPQSLRKLEFSSLPKMTSLPNGLQRLTSLQALNLYCLDKMNGGLPEWINRLSSFESLRIWDCKSITSLPHAIKDLTSLKELSIGRCPNLEERCKEPNGEDFPKIQHIPEIDIGHYNSPYLQSQFASSWNLNVQGFFDGW